MMSGKLAAFMSKKLEKGFKFIQTAIDLQLEYPIVMLYNQNALYFLIFRLMVPVKHHRTMSLNLLATG